MKKQFYLKVLAVIMLITVMTAVPVKPVDAADFTEFEDGEYTIEVELEGGTGRVSITSPCTLLISDGSAIASIEWSSSHYDYMVVDGETYLPVNTDGNSVFEIPVTVLDEPMTVIADTTAMSTPHEIEYELTFDSSSMKAANSSETGISGSVYILIIAAVVIVIVGMVYRKHHLKGY